MPIHIRIEKDIDKYIRKSNRNEFKDMKKVSVIPSKKEKSLKRNKEWKKNPPSFYE